jgi:hypothetical protein
MPILTLLVGILLALLLPGGTLMLIAVAEIKARREAERIIEEDKRQKKVNSAKIAEGTISIYA